MAIPFPLAGYISGPAARLTPIGGAYSAASSISRKVSNHGVKSQPGAPSVKSLRTMNQNKVVKAVSMTNPVVMMDMNLTKLF